MAENTPCQDRGRRYAAPVIGDKPAALKLSAKISATAPLPPAQGRTEQIVFGVGNVNAELMFIGEGPGADEDAQGLPFVGRAGQLLNNMISAMGLKREHVYIANVVKCRPPSNRTPERDECDTCSPFLMRQIDVDPAEGHRGAGRDRRQEPAGGE